MKAARLPTTHSALNSWTCGTVVLLKFGFESGAALATVVGVLIEVPVMLLVVRVVNRTKGWYEAGAAGAG